jgi:hypothetical protein
LDEIVVGPDQSSPDEDEPAENQPTAPTLRSEATDHSSFEGSGTDGNNTQTTNSDSGNQATTNEQPPDMGIDSIRANPGEEPSMTAPISVDVEASNGPRSTDPDGNLMLDTSMANMLASQDWRAIADFSMDALPWMECNTLIGNGVASGVASSQHRRGEDRVAKQEVVKSMARCMQELREILVQWGPKGYTTTSPQLDRAKGTAGGWSSIQPDLKLGTYR